MQHFARQLLLYIDKIIVISHSYVTGFVKRDLFDKFFKLEFSSHLSITGIAPISDLTRAYHTIQLRKSWLSNTMKIRWNI